MSAQWIERRERGGRFGLWLLRTASLALGRRFARIVLYPITLFYFLRRGRERRDSREFLSRALGKPATNGQVLKHIHAYAATILDRTFMLSDVKLSRFQIQAHGLDELEAQMAHGRGVLLLGAHIGSFEALRSLSERRPEVQLRVVMDLQQTPALNELLHALNPKVAANVIDAGVDPGALALALHDAAAKGDLIGLLADRARAGEPTALVDFLGKPASFPTAAYMIASMLDLPVVLAFGIYRGGNRYDIHFETLAQSIKIARSARGEQLQHWAQKFAARLEHYTREYPYNWFNFYDFWHCADGESDARGEPAVLKAGEC